MSDGRAKVIVDVEANVNQINNQLKLVQANLSKLNLPASAEKSFNNLFSKLDAEITNFRAKASSAISSPAELKAFTGSWNKILDLYRKLGIEVKNLGALNTKQLQNLVPSDLATKMSKVTAAMDVFSQKTKKINSEAGSIKGQITKATNSLAGFEKQLALLKSKEVLPDDDFEKLASDARKAANELAAANQELAKAQAAVDAAPRTKTGKIDHRTKAGRDASDDLAAAKARVNTALTDKAKFDGWQDRYVKASSKDTEVTKLEQSISNTQTRIENLKVALNSLTKTDATRVFQELKTKIGEITGVDVSAAQSVDDLKDSLSELTQKSINQAQDAIDSLGKELSQLGPNMQSTSKEVDNTTQSFRQMVNEANSIEQLKSRLVSFFSIGGIIQVFRRAIQSAYESVRELDEAMTATAVVTNYSVGDMWEQLPRYTKMASDLGATLKGAYETMTLFYQQGLDNAQATQLGTETMKMARIAGLDYATATDYMTAALRGFNLELNQLSAQRVNDIYSKLAAITASDTEEISIAMTKTASIADSANMSLETTAALLSQIIETTREAPETAGTAMKTIIARFQELKKAPDEIGEVDGEAIDANKIEGALRTIGVALRDSSGQFRSLDDVFLDISKKWDSLSTNQQRYIATMAAGSRQQSRFIAMMQDYDRTMELVAAANNSAGAAEEQFEKTTDSLQAKVNKLNTAWQTFTMGLANNTLIKGVVDGLRMFLNLLNGITDVLGANGLGDFTITLTLVITLLSKAKRVIDGLLRGAKDFKDMMSGGSKVTQAVGSAVTKGSASGFTAGVRAAAPEITAVVAEAVRNGFVAGSGGTPTSPPQLPPPNDVPSDLPDTTNKRKKGILSGLGSKAGKFVKDTFGEGKDGLNAMRNLGLTVAGVGIAISGATKLIQGGFDDAIQTAGESLEEIGALKPQIKSSISELEERISGITSQKDTYEDNLSTARITGKGDPNYNEAVKSNNNLIRTIRSEFPKLAAEFTKFEDGMWQVKDGFWDEYAKALEDQKAELELMDLSLTAQEAELTYQQSTSNQIETTAISDNEEDEILDSGALGAAIGGVIGGVLGVLLAPVTGGLSLAAVATGAAFLGGAGGGYLAAEGERNEAETGITQEQLDKSLEAIGEFGTLSQDSADQIINAIEKKSTEDLSDDLKGLVADIGGKDEFQALYNAVDGNVDILNEAVVQYQNMKSAQEEYRLAVLRAAGVLDNSSGEPGAPRAEEYMDVLLSDEQIQIIKWEASDDWDEMSDEQRQKYNEKAAAKQGITYLAGVWSKDGTEYEQENIDALGKEYFQKQRVKQYAKGTFTSEKMEQVDYWTEEIRSGRLNIDAVIEITDGSTDDIAHFLKGEEIKGITKDEIQGLLDLANVDESKSGDIITKLGPLAENLKKRAEEASQFSGDDNNASKVYSKTQSLSAAKTVELLDDLDLSDAILEGLNNGTVDQGKVITALSRNIKSMDDVQDMMAALEEAGIDVTESALEVAEKLDIKDLGTALTSETVQAISDKLTSGTALSSEEADIVSRAMGKGGVYEGMTDKQLYDAGFIQTDDGFKPLVSAQEAIKALNNRMASDLGAIRRILDIKYSSWGTLSEKEKEKYMDQAEKDLEKEGIFKYTSTDEERQAAIEDRAKFLYDMETNKKIADKTDLSGQSYVNARATILQNQAVNGQYVDTSQTGIGKYASKENLQLWDQYLDTQLALNDAQARYEQEVKETGATEEKELRRIKEKIVAETQLTNSLTKVGDKVMDVKDALSSKDKNEVAKALNEIAAITSSEFGLDLTPDQVEASKEDFLALAEGGSQAKQALANIASAAAKSALDWAPLQDAVGDTFNLAEEAANANYTLYMKGEVDYTQLYEQLEKALGTADEAMAALQAIAGTQVTITETTKDGKTEIRGHLSSPSSYPGSNRSSSRGGGSSSVYKNEYDKRYNLVQDIAEEQRTLNLLQDQYNDLLLSANVSAEKLSKNYQDQVASLKRTKKLNQELLNYRKKDFQEYLAENSKYSQYGIYNWKDNTIEINWDKINAIKNDELGGKVDEYISKLEEFEGYMDDTNDTLMEINNQVAELAQTQQEAYITGLNSIKDALVEVRQKEIDKLSSLNETINDSNSRMFEAIQKAIDDERQSRENDKTEEDIANKEKRLAQLQMDTSGGNQLEILQLQKEIDEAREGYQDSLVDQQLSRMQEDANAAAEQRERQISLLEEQLEIDQLNGEIWNQVFDIWNTGFTSNGKLDWGSPLGQLLREIADYQSMSDAEKIQYTTDKGNEMALAKAGEALGYSNQIDYSQEIAAAKAGTISSQTGIDYGKLDEEELAQRKKILEQLRNQKIDSTGSNAKKTYEFNEDPNKNKQSTPEEAQQPSKGSGYISSMTSQIGHKTGSADQIKKFQEGYNELISDGLISGTKLNVDGSDGPKTTAAIKQLQELIGVNADGYWGKNSRNAFKNSKFKAYKTGGLADFTGPAWLDGTKSHPELVLNARDTENFIQLKDILSNVLKRDSNKTENSGDNYFEIHIDVERIEDDYDVEQLADKIKGIIQQDAMYRNVNFINHLR